MKSRFQHGSVRYLRIARALRSQSLFWRGWTYPRRRKTSLSLPPRSDVETYYLTRTPAVNTHYPAALSKNDVLSRCSIDARVFEKWILNTPRTRDTDRSVFYKCISRVSALTCASNSWAISRLRESIALLVHLFISAWFTRVRLQLRTAHNRGHK